MPAALLPDHARTHHTAATPRIVGLGASAGGLHALELFFNTVPRGSGLAYVVVQHMDPHHETLLGTLLQRVTAIPVCEAVDGMPIEPDTVYVIPPNRELTVAHGCLHLSHSQQPRGMRLPIDVLFSSLAQDQAERAIGVVLSGMGADGTLGLQAIRTQGGLTLAQQPETAQFDSMPRHAIASGCVDIVAAPDALAQRIGQVVQAQLHSSGDIDTTPRPDDTAPMPVPAPEDTASTLDQIVGLLRDHSKHDLSLYKTSTLLRRIERRVAVHTLPSMAAYAGFLRDNPQELDLLFSEMLIGVTSFFRDAEVWRELKDKVLPDLLARRQGEPKLRAWIVGCSTGEEAYSLAMVFKELVDGLPGGAAHALQIFATDLSAEAIAVARKGLYPAKIANDIDAERLARFFSPQDGGWRIHKDIRDTVLFAQHDVILDPPFTKLDILSCRNVLIYFNATLQHRLLPLFHYSLRPGGIMLLGGSETVGRAQSLFTPLNPKIRLYLRNEHALNALAVDFPINRHASSRTNSQETAVSTTPSPPNNLQALADQVLLQAYSPPAVLVNPDGDILYISGRTGRYLEPAAGKANWNIHVMARPGIRTQLAVALRQALQESKPVELHGLRMEDEPHATLHVTVQAVHEPKALNGMVMIVFREVPNTAPPKRRRSSPLSPPVDAAMAAELDRAHEEIHALRREMQSSKEELQAANEALQSANEELQSANEELTTSKEEAQSMNEELQTINGEL
ncbi:MAG TPA: chemotaxis protein CheB, partial [Aquabacterium sp.]|uniref:chemotaxis protein CheB n=1 Tax=Aquabacterium sp. TaxID=1872578 RepID=UPI002E32CCC7